MTAIRDDAACTGAVVRKPPMKETAGGVARWRVRRYGDLTAVVTECEYSFCDMARTLRMGENTFRRACKFQRVARCKKGTYYNLCVMCLMAAFVPHRPNKYCHVTASNGIVLSSPYTPLAIMTASPIASVRVFEPVRDADVGSLRSVRSQRRRRYREIIMLNNLLLAPHHHQVRRSHRSIYCWHGHAAAPYRASGFVLWHV